MKPEQCHELWTRVTVLNELRWLEDGQRITRDELARRVQARALGELGVEWKCATAARRVREALAALVEEGYPVSSSGSGFRISDTAGAREEAARKLERAAHALLRRAEAIRSAPQRLLPLEVANG